MSKSSLFIGSHLFDEPLAIVFCSDPLLHSIGNNISNDGAIPPASKICKIDNDMDMTIRVHIYNKANRFAFRDYTFINFGNLSQLKFRN